MRTKSALILYLVAVAALGVAAVVSAAFPPQDDASTATHVNADAFVQALADGRIDRVTYHSKAQSFTWIDGRRNITPVVSSFAPTIRRMARDAGVPLTIDDAQRRVLGPIQGLTLALGLLVFAVVPVAVGVDLVYRTFTDRASGRPLLWAAFVLVVPVVGAATYFGLRRDTLGRAFGAVAIAGALVAVALPAYLAVLPQPPASGFKTAKPATR